MEQNSPKKILCIEDERFISELYARALQKAGYEVVIATEGTDGLEQAMSDEYDIVLLDIMLPNINGVDILEKMRRADKPLHCKIIITTNLDQREDIRKQVESLADGYLIKAEITPKELVEYLAQLHL